RFLGPANVAFSAPALFERARIEEASGDTAAAVADYRAFLERYDLPRGDWAVRVDNTRSKLRCWGAARARHVCGTEADAGGRPPRRDQGAPPRACRRPRR